MLLSSGWREAEPPFLRGFGKTLVPGPVPHTPSLEFLWWGWERGQVIKVGLPHMTCFFYFPPLDIFGESLQSPCPQSLAMSLPKRGLWLDTVREGDGLEGWMVASGLGGL